MCESWLHEGPQTHKNKTLFYSNFDTEPSERKYDSRLASYICVVKKFTVKLKNDFSNRKSVLLVLSEHVNFTKIFNKVRKICDETFK